MAFPSLVLRVIRPLFTHPWRGRVGETSSVARCEPGWGELPLLRAEFTPPRSLRSRPSPSREGEESKWRVIALYRCSSPDFTRTSVHFLYSDTMNWCHASGVELLTITPVLLRRSRVSGSWRISFSALLSLAITAGGMPFGPYRPYHVVTS